MTRDLCSYIRDPGLKQAVTGPQAAITTDNAIITETMMEVLRAVGNAADAAIAGSMVQAAVEPSMINHAGLVTFLYYEAKTGEIHQLDRLGSVPFGLPPFKPVPPGTGPYAYIPPSGIARSVEPGDVLVHDIETIHGASVKSDGVEAAAGPCDALDGPECPLSAESGRSLQPWPISRNESAGSAAARRRCHGVRAVPARLIA